MACPRVLDALRLTESKPQEKPYAVLSGSQLVELISQYPILASIATELSERDLISLALACKTTLAHLTSPANHAALLKGLVQSALQCKGLGVQLRPVANVDPKDVCWLPCSKTRPDVRRCHGCGTAVCHGCRFRITHGTMLTLPAKRHWFFPSQTQSGLGQVNDNLECLVSSFAHKGHPSVDGGEDKPCTCTYEERWLDNWLCVPCLNKDLLS